MTLARWEMPVIDDEGNLQTSVYCEVRKEGVSGNPLATLYSDRDGVTPLGNPFLASDGIPAFHAAGGAYKVYLYKTGYSRTLRYQAVGTGAEVDTDQLLIPGYLFEFETATTAPPGTGGIRANNATLTSATRLYIWKSTIAGVDISARIVALLGKRLLLTSTNAGEQFSAQVDLVTDQTTYYELVISSTTGATSFPAGRVGLQTDGATGAAGSNGVFNGAAVSLTNASETVIAAYNGKNLLLDRATAMTLGATAAATLGAAFMVPFKNINTGTATFDPNGAELIDGIASLDILPGESGVLFCDGSAWRSLFLSSALPVPASRGGTGATTVMDALRNLSAASVGSHSNLGLSASVAANALTVDVLGADGNAPSTTNPVVLAFRNATLTSGLPTLIAITSALSLTISSGSTMGFANSTPGRLWLVAFNDAGTVRLGLINCLNGTSIVALRNGLRASSTAEGGAGAADSAGVFYTGAAVSAKDYVVLGSLDWASGLATAGTWASAPTTVAIRQPGDPMPGDVLQTVRTELATVDTTTTVIPNDDTIPQITEGKEYATAAITPISAVNALRIKAAAYGTTTANPNSFIVGLFQDATANALNVGSAQNNDAGTVTQASVEHVMRAATASSTTLRARYGPGAAATATLNGAASARKFGGVIKSFIEVTEIVA